jgi:hypothetical protein
VAKHGLLASTLAAALVVAHLAGPWLAGACGQDFYEGRKTLLQWAGSMEEGGPPGWDEPLSSDRPDFVETSVTVGRGVRQLEMGYTYFLDDDGVTRTTAHSFPEFLLRVGVWADWLELRAGWNYSSSTQNFDPLTRSISGGEDLYLGIKFGLTGQDGILPEMSLVTQMTVPTGHPALTGGKVLPGMNWLYGWDITEFVSFAGSTQANLAIDDLAGDEFLEFAQAFTFGFTLTEKLGAYTEWFMITPAGAEITPTQHFMDGGFTYKVSNDLQLDIRIGKGISGASDDLFAGTGAVVRW